MKGLVRKPSITLALLTVIVLAIAYAGRQMIVSSSVYEASLLEMQKRYGAKPEDLSIRMLRPFKFSNGNSEGHAEFVLCESSTCHQINARKSAGIWQVDAAKK